MKLVTFTSPEVPVPRAGILQDGGVHPFPRYVRGIDIIQAADDYVAARQAIPLEDVTLHVPFRPRMIIAIGRNYADHAAEMQSEVPERPLIFAVLPSAVIGPNMPISWRSSVTQKVDWEGELGVVIGRTARDVSEADALDYVYGYVVANDVTARDLQKKIDKQWTRGKSLDTFCPIGPSITTRADIPDPQALTVTTRINGEVMQQGNTSSMIFDVATLVSYCSRMFTLAPGDLLLTGTPPGVGAGRTPPVFLGDGDEVAVEIEGVGTLQNSCRVLD